MCNQTGLPFTNPFVIVRLWLAKQTSEQREKRKNYSSINALYTALPYPLPTVNMKRNEMSPKDDCNTDNARSLQVPYSPAIYMSP